MKYQIFTTKKFDKQFSKLDHQVQREIENEIDQLESNPYSGKSLGYKFFREKKIKGYRIYYLIYEEHVVVFVITLSGKKDQQKAIDTIKNLLPLYREEIRKRLNL